MTNTINFIFIAVIAVLFVVNLFALFIIFKVKKRVNLFFQGKKARDLESVILEQAKKVKENEEDINKALERIVALEKISEISFQKIGIKRFNPFNDVGGDQSFILVLLDKQNNGFVVSSLYTRDGNRVYAKAIKGGKSQYTLSKEEEEVISQAIKGKRL